MYKNSKDIHDALTTKKSWHKYIDSDYSVIPDDVSPSVAEDWQRCARIGVPHSRTFVNRVIEGKELSDRITRNHVLLAISNPILRAIDSFVSSDGFVTSIADSDGIVISSYGDHKLARAIKEGGWKLGADWSELSIGNNTLGTPLATGMPRIINGYDHFCRCCHRFAGAGAPIKVDNKVIGVIGIVGPSDTIHKHALGMVIAAAEAIQRQKALKEFADKQTFFLNYQTALLDTIKDGVIGVDTDGKISFCNTPACKLLGVPEKSILKKRFWDLVEPDVKKWMSNPLRQNEEQEVIFQIDGVYSKNITSFQIVNFNNESGYVISLRNTSAVINTSRRFVEMKPKWNLNDIIGKNQNFMKHVRLASFAAKSDVPILITGESGTGKEVIAASIHNASERKDKPFVAINCGAIPEALIESELFGYKEGAFTGAKKGGSIGKLSAANGGTFFMDEIAELTLTQQKVLLRVLEEREFYPVGSTTPVQMDARIISATNKNMLDEISAGRFRLDLFYRLNVFELETIPLRDRKDDIVLLAANYLKKYASNNLTAYYELSPEVISKLCSYNYPGNIRELQNILSKALILSDGGKITPEMIIFPKPTGTVYYNINTPSQINDIPDLPGGVNSPTSYVSPAETPEIPEVPSFEPAELHRTYGMHGKDDVLNALIANYWNVSKASKDLSVSRTTLYRLMKKFNIYIPR